MGVIRRAGAVRPAVAGESVRFDDFARGRELAQEAAQEMAQRILGEARREAERLRAEAKAEGERAGVAEGRERGLAEGREQGRAEAKSEWDERLSTLHTAWERALAGFEAQREAIVRGAMDDLLQIASDIASRATHRAIDAAPGRVAAASVRALIDGCSARTRLAIRVHPEDAPDVSELWGTLVARAQASEHVELVEDATLERGSCVAVSEGGALMDESAATRLERIIDELLGRGGA